MGVQETPRGACGRATSRGRFCEDVHWAFATLLDLVEYSSGLDSGAGPARLPGTTGIDRPPARLAEPPAERRRAHGRSALRSGCRNAPRADFARPAPWRRAGRGGSAPDMGRSGGGNPLFLEQMAAMLAESDGGDAVVAVPPSIQALLAERLDQLSDDERAVIERAAVIGREFWFSAVVDLSSPAIRPAVGSLLMALVRKELIRPDESQLAGEDGIQVPAHPHPRRGIRGASHERAGRAPRTFRALARTEGRYS